MRLLLLRHGTTPGNLKKQYIGSTDQPLASVGIEQARERAEELPPVERVWVSTMTRARQTADIFYPNTPKAYLDELREMDFGDCEEKTWEEINDPTIYDGWLAEDPQACFPGGETLEHLKDRTDHALQVIAARVKRDGLESGAIVSHGGIMMMMMSVHGVPKKKFFDWESANCGGFVVEFDPDTLELRLMERIGAGRIW